MNSSQTVEISEVKDDVTDPPGTPVDIEPADNSVVMDTSDNVERQDLQQEDEDDFDETTPTNERSMLGLRTL